MRKVGPFAREALHDSQATRAIEQAASASLAPGTLMAGAGLAVAQLARALAPHARCIWVACGPGNNGGDGLVAAVHLQAWAMENGHAPQIVVTLRADERHLPDDAARALRQAREAGLNLSDTAPDTFDLAIDALFGIGARRPAEGLLASDLERLARTEVPVLCVDAPSDLDADTGARSFQSGTLTKGADARSARHTLSLLTLKPGLFTASGRDCAGTVWFDDLGCTPAVPATAWLSGFSAPDHSKQLHAHSHHKGSYGEVAVVGGQDIAVEGAGMTGAAVLAARAALQAGAGRVYVGLLGGESGPSVRWDPVAPELMFREPARLVDSDLFRQASVVCGCGGGSQITALLPRILSRATRLVLDADALNALPGDAGLQALLKQRQGRGWITVLTPHPLEAARLLGISTAEVMANRLATAQQLADKFHAICVLKGSGTVIVAQGETPLINPSGNAALATAGTGDVLAGMVGAALARVGAEVSEDLELVAAAVFQHGLLADRWGMDLKPQTLTASLLAASTRPIQ